MEGPRDEERQGEKGGGGERREEKGRARERNTNQEAPLGAGEGDMGDRWRVFLCGAEFVCMVTGPARPLFCNASTPGLGNGFSLGGVLSLQFSALQWFFQPPSGQIATAEANRGSN